MTNLCQKVEKIETEVQNLKTNSQQHDSKNAELGQQHDQKHAELQGDVGKLRKTHNNVCSNAATASTSTAGQSTKKEEAKPGTNPNLIATCYNYGLLSTVYTVKGDEISKILELYKAFLQYKRITKGSLFYIKFYAATAEILYDEVKPTIQVIKIGLTREMIIPEKIDTQEEIQKVDIPEFYANKRTIGIATILNEITNNYLNENAIWTYYNRDQTIIYSNCRDIREADMEELRQWILSLLRPETTPTTRAIRKNFISSNLMTRYCKLIGQKYPDHLCSKCEGEENYIPDVQLE
ncbi:uncharacterized protein LOC107024889 [Solanum pennellii]|uniref:Uncharacterized protein LOC107024889 n=1 Tax=Solanum pennellii TaxID=28526 RepID=A0ABM1VEW6_SOLPN|nr:uncharacterized protein LOC107024889 [Solanum pennellii]